MYSITLVQIAYALGLSRLGPENPTANYEEVGKSYGSRWAGAIDREVARRVWYALVSPSTFLEYRHDLTRSLAGRAGLDILKGTQLHVYHSDGEQQDG